MRNNLKDILSGLTKTNFNDNSLKVIFNDDIIIKRHEVKEIKVSEIKIRKIIDESKLKRVTAYTDKLGVIVLWEGDAYDNIGQWTDTDVQNRIIEMYI